MKVITPGGTCTVILHDIDEHNAGATIKLRLQQMHRGTFVVCFKQKHGLLHPLQWVNCNNSSEIIQDWIHSKNAFSRKWEIPVHDKQGKDTIIRWHNFFNNVQVYNVIIQSLLDYS